MNRQMLQLIRSLTRRVENLERATENFPARWAKDPLKEGVYMGKLNADITAGETSEVDVRLLEDETVVLKHVHLEWPNATLAADTVVVVAWRRNATKARYLTIINATCPEE